MIYPGPLDEFGVEDLLPAVQALDVSSVIEKAGDAFPVAGSVLVHQLLELLVLLGGPPSLFQRTLVLRVLLVLDLRNLFQHLVHYVLVRRRLVLRRLIVYLFEVRDGSPACVFVQGFQGFGSKRELLVIYGVLRAQCIEVRLDLVMLGELQELLRVELLQRHSREQ